MSGRTLLYILILTIPLFLGGLAWQAIRYNRLEQEVVRLEAAQEEWVDSNKRLIAGIAVLSSAERIERIAQEELALVKKQPEEILQIRIERRSGLDG